MIGRNASAVDFAQHPVMHANASVNPEHAYDPSSRNRFPATETPWTAYEDTADPAELNPPRTEKMAPMVVERR